MEIRTTKQIYTAVHTLSQLADLKDQRQPERKDDIMGNVLSPSRSGMTDGGTSSDGTPTNKSISKLQYHTTIPTTVSPEECQKLSDLIGSKNTPKLVKSCKIWRTKDEANITDEECSVLLDVLLKGLGGNIDDANDHLPRACGRYIGRGRVV